jgi:hypothetical protein
MRRGYAADAEDGTDRDRRHSSKWRMRRGGSRSCGEAGATDPEVVDRRTANRATSTGKRPMQSIQDILQFDVARGIAWKRVAPPVDKGLEAR